MKLSSSLLSVVVIAVSLCMLDKHVFGDEITCNTECPGDYAPVCAQPKNEEEFQTFKNQCELEKKKKCDGEDAWIFIKQEECTD